MRLLRRRPPGEPCVVLSPGDVLPTSATGSYVGGCPYSMDDRPWPEWLGRPMFFLAQLAFADLTPIDGFPTAGLLQWFVGADDGFEIRAYADTKSAPLHHPLDPTPWHAARAGGGDLAAPIEDAEPAILLVSEGRRELATPGRVLVELQSTTGVGRLLGDPGALLGETGEITSHWQRG